MAIPCAFGRKDAARSAVLLFCLALLQVAYLWHQGGDAGPRTYLSRRYAHDDHLVDTVNSTLVRRDDYTCAKGKPCGNGACCGASGYCGYGPTYCGQGCSSNCNAKAPCGQYAEPAGKQCPLNTCCSQYGFCGTTEEFCGTKCQSNCVLHPSPPGGGSSTPILQNKVIGYYESWSARKACHKVGPTDLPLDALTHVNYAFAYIDPATFQVVTMDGETPSSSFQDTTNIKSIKPSIKVFVSIGGWTFSDNDTATQPVYGNIAASAGNRQTFANNVVHFMKQYGFDGLDIDWEYPGAPDRGGKTQDTANYVALLQTLRQTFDASGNSYGLTFTAPTSYWYLRWFDLPNMVKYVDWINLMSYDLHGVWDRDNPIGSIVQGHTNLTEIKLAAELFWRVNIPPAKLVLGFGFYGRAFTLSSPGCSTPGCGFSGASDAGPCTGQGGILGFYEIQDILKDNSIKPIHDQASAVNYFVWNNNQWISYDDSVSFAQKVAWANSVGLGGAMIWASDLDDDKYTAHSALLGRTISSTPQLQLQSKIKKDPPSVIQDLAGNTGQNCFKYDGKCVNLNDNNAIAKACGDKYTAVGWDDAGCGKKNCHCGKPICCPTNQAPQNCQWRGDNTGGGSRSDCNGQCNVGEINIQGIASSWGGGFKNDGNTNKCGRGYKVFCCPAPDAGQVTQGCRYAACRSSCGIGTASVFSKTDDCFLGSKQYCCPTPVKLKSCHWVRGSAGSDCANARCNSTELEIDRSRFGDGQLKGCSWSRKQAACCSIDSSPPPPATCSADLCKIIPDLCANNGGNHVDSPFKRDLVDRGLGLISTNSTDIHALDKRGGDQTYNAHLPNGVVLVVIGAIYPEIGRLFGVPNAGQVLRQLFRLIPGYCLGPAIQESPVAAGANPGGLTGFDTEHPIDRQLSARFLEAATSGLLRNRAPPTNGLQPINAGNLENYWTHPLHQLGNGPALGSAFGPQSPTANDRFMEAFGCTGWPAPLVPTDHAINGPKGNLMNLAAPIGIGEIRRLARQAAASGNAQDTDALLQAVRIGFALFEYFNNADFAARFRLVRNQVRTQLGLIEAAFAQEGVPVTGLQNWWDTFLTDYLYQMEQWAQSWTQDAIAEAARPFQTTAGALRPNAQQIINTLMQWDTMIDTELSFSFTYGIVRSQIP